MFESAHKENFPKRVAKIKLGLNKTAYIQCNMPLVLKDI